MAPGQVYPKKKENRVNRYNQLEDYTLDTIKSIMDSCKVVHVGFVDDGAPVVMPYIGAMGQFEHEPYAMYVHGYVSSRIMRLMKSKNHADHPKVCVTGSRVDGLILSLTPFSHNYNYRSAILHGTASFLEDLEEKEFAMHTITNHVHPNRWNESRTPPTKTELASTGIIKITIQSASAKIHTGPPEDKDANDLANTELRSRVWVGTIPLYEQMGDPITADYSLVKKTPESIKQVVRTRNAKERDWAVLVAKEKLGLPLEHENGA